MIVVTGVSSSPGWGIAVELKKAGREVVGIYYRNPVGGVEAYSHDLVKNPGAVLEYSPDVVIHAASIGDVDMCETEREFCWRVNVVAARELFRAVCKRGVRVLYISTDYVFSGEKGLYKEDDVPRPINFYGLTKLVAEEAALAQCGSVVRISAVFGPGPGRPNFAKVVYQKLKAGQPVEAAVDQYLSPTYNLALGKAIVKLLDKDFSILHVAGPRLSRFDYARLAATVLGVDVELVRPTTMDKIPYRAPRPRDSSLDNTKAAELTGVSLSDMRTFLSEYFRALDAV